MKLAVLSDSHIPQREEEIPETFWTKVEEADITIHAGDFTAKETYNALEEYSKKFYPVKGNCDFFKEPEPPRNQTFTEKNIDIGVYHGTGIKPRGHHPTLKKIAQKDLNVKLLIHGHTHQEEIHHDEEKEITLVNPGSCTGAGGGTANPSTPTMAKINLKEETIQIKIINDKEEIIDEKTIKR